MLTTGSRCQARPNPGRIATGKADGLLLPRSAALSRATSPPRLPLSLGLPKIRSPLLYRLGVLPGHGKLAGVDVDHQRLPRLQFVDGAAQRVGPGALGNVAR